MDGEKPILFSGPMVRAILEGRKTQTRRVIRDDWWRCLDPEDETDRERAENYCPFGIPGDTLWVREAFSFRDYGPIGMPDLDREEVWYWADGPVPTHGNWTRPKPSIHLPRTASRLDLRVTGVRVERLNEITDADAIAEGVRCWVCGGPVDGTSENDCACFHTKAHAAQSFGALWESINGKRAPWASNPWVWVVSFERKGSEAKYGT